LNIEDFEFQIPYVAEIYGKMDRFRAYFQADGIESYGRDNELPRSKLRGIKG